MFKKIFLMALIALLPLQIFAHGMEWAVAGTIVRDADWTPVQINIFPIHLFSIQTDVYGIVLSPGLLGGGQHVCGLSCGVVIGAHNLHGIAAGVLSMGQYNNGLSIGVFNTWESNNGVSIGLANFLMSGDQSRNTLQIGLYNQANSGLQIGLLNHNPNALIPWMPLFNWSAIPENRKLSCQESLAELRKSPSPLDDKMIRKHGKNFLPYWTREEQIAWVVALQPLTDAGSSTALLEVVRKNQLTMELHVYAFKLPQEKRKKLLDWLGSTITQDYWTHRLEVKADGTCTLFLKDTRSGSECSFRAKFKDLPDPDHIIVTPMNSDLAVNYSIHKKIDQGGAIGDELSMVTLFEVRRDAETNLWFETGSPRDVDAKKPAVTTYQEIRNASVYTGHKGNRAIYKTFRLKDSARKIKLGRLQANDVETVNGNAQ